MHAEVHWGRHRAQSAASASRWRPLLLILLLLFIPSFKVWAWVLSSSPTSVPTGHSWKCRIPGLEGS